MSRVQRILGLILTLSLTQAGCTAETVDGSNGGPENSPSSQATAAEWAPITDPQPADSTPEPISATPDLADVAGADVEVRTRLGAERFALNAARLLMDVRTDASSPEVADAIFGDGASMNQREYAAQQLEGQKEIGFRRQVDSRREQWIQSSADEPARPSKVDVEVALNVSTPGDPFDFWGIIRVDAVWQDGRWKAIAFSEGPSGPLTGKDLTRAERESFLPGPGWRRVPPA